MVIQSWSRLIRLPNLFILAISQWTVYFFMLRPFVQAYEQSFELMDFNLLVTVSICVAASGYVINNIYDRFIDRHQIDLRIIPDVFSLRFSWILYLFLVLSGFAISYYLSWKTGRNASLILYPIAIILLWAYSAVFKCTPVIGNLLVSCFTSFGILIIPYAFQTALHEMRLDAAEIWLHLVYKLTMLSLFAFVLNFIRELIKDMQDRQQDQSENCISTAVYFGVENTKRIAFGFYLVLLILQCLVAYPIKETVHWIYYCLLMASPSVLILYFMIAFYREWPLPLLSKLIKVFMLSGLLFWCLLK